MKPGLIFQIDFVAHDDIPYISEGHEDVYKFVKDSGHFWPTKRTSGVSTSDLITRIVRDYDLYLRRNLERGVPAKELNISFLKESEVKMKKQVSEIADILTKKLKDSEHSIKNNWQTTRNDFSDSLQFWEEKSQEFIKDFAALFDPVARIFKNLTKEDKEK